MTNLDNLFQEEKLMPNSTKTLKDLTVTDLENLIETIVKRTLQQEQKKHKQLNTINNQTLLNTFGTWEDEKTEDEIIEEIYNSRNSNLNLI